MIFAKLNTSIKRQLFVALASFTLFLCVSYTGVAVLIAYVTEDTVLESILNHEAKHLQEHYTNTATWKQPSIAFMRLVPSLEQLAEPLKSEVQEANQRNKMRAEVFTHEQTHFHMMRLSKDSQGPYLVAEVSPFLVVGNLSKNLADFMIFVAIFMLAGALLLAYRLAKHIAAPLVQLNEEIKDGINNQHQGKFTALQRVDEIGFLAQTLSQNLQSLQAALQRESLFTRDVSHELRTPVTIIKNLLQTDSKANWSQDDRQLLSASMAEIDQTLTILLALARAENLALEQTNLQAHLEHAILNLEKTAQAHQRQFSLEFDDAMFEKNIFVMANPTLLTLLFNNLLNNALFHGGQQVLIRIHIDADQLVIANTIHSSSPTQTSGFTHGKNLLTRIAQALEWSIEFQQSTNYFEARVGFNSIS
ncbi:sensor histidine kinase [Undibacterium baiyunense]|uniref:histidine kinase n=1 Tax=Undibacterium baiyunense TaxID=2828731 RepID=A0A941DCK2_9BURK|nr:histidine kinase dimerization/phospho-acceptor domain-containing protein [Undibacterium baiyunense]MBR7746234.1 hypothetical protein [Undibacterium baiyunense]